ncbi:MAG: efflux RND transporter periplasmic adaptor subunit [Bacteroidia bacterium]
MKTSTKIIIVAALVIIVGGIIAKKAGWIGKSTALEISAEKPIKRTIVETVSANGKIQPEVEVKISADVSGEIVELFVIEGQKVNKGDHLLTINPDLIKAAADRVAAALNQTKANLANSRARETQVKAAFVNTEITFNRTKTLYEKKAVSDAEFDAAKAQYEGAKADLEAAKQTVLASEFSVKSAEASLKEANDNLARTRIYSPTDGTVSQLNVELGERVVGTAQMSGTELLRIANLNEMEVSVDVNENDIVRIHLNDTTMIEVDAYGDREFRGIVTEIANSANSSALGGNSADQVTNFTVKIRILRESYTDLIDADKPYLSPFRPGMSATVDIRTQVKYGILSVPIMSVTTRTTKEMEEKADGKTANEADSNDEAKADDEIKEVIFVVSEGKASIREVKTGIQDNNYIEVTSGIDESLDVVSAPYSAISKLLKEGTEVTVKISDDINSSK